MQAGSPGKAHRKGGRQMRQTQCRMAGGGATAGHAAMAHRGSRGSSREPVPGASRGFQGGGPGGIPWWGRRIQEGLPGRPGPRDGLPGMASQGKPHRPKDRERSAGHHAASCTCPVPWDHLGASQAGGLGSARRKDGRQVGPAKCRKAGVGAALVRAALRDAKVGPTDPGPVATRGGHRAG